MVIAESMARRLTAFDVAVDGSLTNQRVWAQFDDVVPDGGEPTRASPRSPLRKLRA